MRWLAQFENEWLVANAGLLSTATLSDRLAIEQLENDILRALLEKKGRPPSPRRSR